MAKNMEDYIAEITPTYLKNIENREKLTGILVKMLKDEHVEDRTLTIVASGSSYNAAMCALPFLKKYVGTHTRVITPFAYTYYETVSDDNIYLFVSQSGYSTNILGAAQKHKENHRKVIGITGNRESDLGKMSDICLEYGAGEETIGYVTKGMSTLILFFMLLGLELIVKKNAKTYTVVLEHMTEAAKAHALMYQQAKDFCMENREKLMIANSAFLIAGGANMGTVSEGALKISEMVHIQTTVYEIEEFIHGPDLQLTPESTLFFTCVEDETKERVLQVYEASGLITENTFLVRFKDLHMDQIYAPLYFTAFYQYLAFFVAKEKGITSEHPLHKKFEEIVRCKSDGYTESNPF